MIGPPIKKWLGVRTLKSVGSIDIKNNGREFSAASTWQSIVVVSSYVSNAPLVARTSCHYADLTALSHNPPKCGAEGGIKCHFISLVVKKSLTFLLRIICKTYVLSTRLALTKFEPLSLYKIEHWLLRDIKRDNVARKSSVDKEETSSKRIARVTKDAYVALGRSNLSHAATDEDRTAEI